jgi:hypothetical protein
MDYFFANTRDGSTPAKEFRASGVSLTEQASRFASGCSSTLNPAVAMAEQPGMIAQAGHGMEGGGCTVDLNTDLRWGIEGSHREKGKKQMWARPFATTPNLGGGDQEAVDTESSLIHSATIRNRKEVNTIMDRTIPHFFQPLLDIKQQEYKNTNNWVEGWTRGGDSARLIKTKRNDE